MSGAREHLAELIDDAHRGLATAEWCTAEVHLKVTDNAHYDTLIHYKACTPPLTNPTATKSGMRP